MNKKNEMMEPKKEYWKSLSEYENGAIQETPFLNEFPEQVKAGLDTNSMSPLSRRKFFALLGASSAFALASCSKYRDKGEIVTYNNKPEFATMGSALYYASTLNDGSGVLIKTREGRPIKIDGNPEHPINQGKLNQFGHATILNLYDPARLKNPLRKKDSSLALYKDDMLNTDWATADKEVIDLLNKTTAEGKEIAIISHTIISPTQKKVFDDFKTKYPTTQIYSYELHSDKNHYGMKPAINWKNVRTILAIESDFLGNEGVVEDIRGFSENRNIEKPEDFNRLYCIEAAMSQTGMNADYRMRLDPRLHLKLLTILESELKNKINYSKEEIQNLKLSNDSEIFIKENKLNSKYFKYLLKDLLINKGSAIVLSGEKLGEIEHSISKSINELLGEDTIFDYSLSKIVLDGNIFDFEHLVKTMNNGKVGVVIHFDSNPVYHLADDFGYKEALKKVETVVTFTLNANESSALSKYIFPINHDLESWGDFHNYSGSFNVIPSPNSEIIAYHNVNSGIYSLQQPVIEPLYNTRQKEAVLLTWTSGKAESFNNDIYHKYLMEHWESNIYVATNSSVEFRKFWLSVLHDGFFFIKPKDKYQKDKYFIDLSNHENKLSSELKKENRKTDSFVVMLCRNYSVGDGRYADNGWLQELPHPVTKACWDNYASISPQTAKELGVKNNDVIEIAIENRKLEIPVMLQPGMADKTIAIELGYGRSVAGEVGTGVGHNANVLLSKNGGITDWIYSGATVKKTGKTFPIFSTQEHHPLDEELVKDIHLKREIIQEGTVEEYLKNPKFLKEHKEEIISITPEREYKGVKWAMAIDLNKCTACGNCVLSCNVENNVPVVGKDQVANGREMHWMRIDRYYSGTPDEPKVSIQPMLCQQCDHAPCENVCPVVATTHSDDGLNQMVYNRCVGTRYCSNNCPYKVRRFNFFNFRDHFANGVQLSDSLKLMHNPEVTVRSRGVMEKCTFCLQRISEARQEATKSGRPLKGTDVKTACQMACPANAIVFGDMNDPESEISKLREHNLGYHVLEQLNVVPNITYVAKLRNKYTEEDSANRLHS